MICADSDGKRLPGDFVCTELDNVRRGTIISTFSREKVYAEQTSTEPAKRAILMTTDPGDLVLDPTCVRKGTRVWRVSGPPVVPPHAGGQGSISWRETLTRGVRSAAARGRQENSLPASGEGRGGAGLPANDEHRGGAASLTNDHAWGGAELVPIESIQPGDWVLAHDGLPHRVLRTIRRPYRGRMIGIRHARSDATLWLTSDHKVLAKPRPRTLGGNADWSGIPRPLRSRSKELRRDMTPPERKLWSTLRRDQTGFAFRRQHPIGPYIADFYSRRARLVVEVDGAAAHSGESATVHDHIRDTYLRSLGLEVLRVPAQDVMENLDGVYHTIRTTCEGQMSLHDAQWIEAGELAVGDLVFFGAERAGVAITALCSENADEEVYDLEVEGAHSFITEICVVHNAARERLLT